MGARGPGAIRAVELASERQPDVVVLDLHMPQMSGVEALGHIRRACPAARIAVISAVLGEHSIEALRAEGADVCVSKATPARSIVDLVAGTLVPR